MKFKRVLDSSYPRVWDNWLTDGVSWVIQDLPPEHDETALDLLVENFSTDETLCAHSGFVKDPVSINSTKHFWLYYLSQRMSLACYREINGNRELVALNVLYVKCRDDEEDNIPIEGVAWNNVFGALKIADAKVDPFEYLATDKVLHALGLVVRRDCRGHRLGARILAARKPLSLHFGIIATCTVFTGVTSQRSAERAGFTTVATVTWRELAETGLNYVSDEDRCIKVMVKKFK